MGGADAYPPSGARRESADTIAAMAEPPSGDRPPRPPPLPVLPRRNPEGVAASVVPPVVPSRPPPIPVAVAPVPVVPAAPAPEIAAGSHPGPADDDAGELT